MKKLLFKCLLGVAVLMAGCSQESVPETTAQEESLKELKAIATEFGFPYMPISYESNQPLTDEYRNEFINKLMELKEIRDNAKEVVMPDTVLSRALSDRSYHGAVNINGCSFPLHVYWDEEFSHNSLYAIAQGACLHNESYHGYSSYVKEVKLIHVSTKESASHIPILYFVIRCNLLGYANGSSSTYAFQKHVEFILKLDVERLKQETTITVLADNIWGPKDFPLDY